MSIIFELSKINEHILKIFNFCTKLINMKSFRSKFTFDNKIFSFIRFCKQRKKFLIIFFRFANNKFIKFDTKTFILSNKIRNVEKRITMINIDE